MKLKLEELAPYLPYKLYVYDTIIKKWKVMNMGQGSSENWTGIKTVLNYSNTITIYKPILRPLSDLSSLGKENIPINEHTINMLIGDNETYGEVEFSHYKGELDFTVESDSNQRYDSSKTISFGKFEIVRNELLKGHYDIFGLIKKGLAIDINTL